MEIKHRYSAFVSIASITKDEFDSLVESLAKYGWVKTEPIEQEGKLYMVINKETRIMRAEFVINVPLLNTQGYVNCRTDINLFKDLAGRVHDI